MNANKGCESLRGSLERKRMVWRLLGFVGYVSDVSSAGSTRVRPGESSMLGLVAGACHLSMWRTCFDTCEVPWDALPG